MAHTLLTHIDFEFSRQACSKVQHGATLPSPGSLCSSLSHYQLCRRGDQTSLEEQVQILVLSPHSTAVELEMKWVKEI